jgi:hypothetical protein
VVINKYNNDMQVKSIYRFARISAFKAREVTREIQGLPATDALDLLGGDRLLRDVAERGDEHREVLGELADAKLDAPDNLPDFTRYACVLRDEHRRRTRWRAPDDVGHHDCGCVELGATRARVELGGGERAVAKLCVRNLCGRDGGDDALTAPARATQSRTDSLLR